MPFNRGISVGFVSSVALDDTLKRKHCAAFSKHHTIYCKYKLHNILWIPIVLVNVLRLRDSVAFVISVCRIDGIVPFLPVSAPA